VNLAPMRVKIRDRHDRNIIDGREGGERKKTSIPTKYDNMII